MPRTAEDEGTDDELPSLSVPGLRYHDIYGWKPSDYLIANGAIDSLLLVCASVLSYGSFGFSFGRRPRIDFDGMAQCYSKLFTNILMQVPPELSARLGEDWPSAGKSSRQLAQDLGHTDIVELIDFMRLHAEGHLLFSHLKSTNASSEGSFAKVKVKARAFAALVEAGAANSKCILE